MGAVHEESTGSLWTVLEEVHRGLGGIHETGFDGVLMSHLYFRQFPLDHVEL